MKEDAGLVLISHALCPYVQRAIIVALEKKVAHERIYVDLAAKPDWFLALSPTGKVPVLRVGETVLFESIVICEYLDETTDGSLHADDPLARARDRAWMEYSSALLGDLYQLVIQPDEQALLSKREPIRTKFDLLERTISSAGPWFNASGFRMVDAIFAPMFRYFEAIDRVVDHGLFATRPRLAAWRAALAARSSVVEAAPADYVARFAAAQLARGSWLGKQLTASLSAR